MIKYKNRGKELMHRRVKHIASKLLAFFINNYLVVFFLLAAFIKLYVINTYLLKVTWPNDQYVTGLVMSFTALLLVFTPKTIREKRKSRRLFIASFNLSLLLFIDVIYFSYFGSIPSVGSLSSAGNTGDVLPAIMKLINPFQFLLFIDLPIAFILDKKIKNKVAHALSKLPKRHKSDGLVATLFAVIIFSGSISYIGISKITEIIDKSWDSKATAQYVGILGTHAVDITRFIIHETTYLSQKQVADLKKWTDEHRTIPSVNKLTGTAKNKNIIMIQVESLGGFVIGQQFNGKEITPNLNKLASNTQFFPNNRFLIGAGHTSDADLVANTSLIPLDNSATFVRYGQDDFTGIAKVMTQIGYSTTAYHGFTRDFWNRDVALRSLGYQKFYAADNYSKGFQINMGLNDGTFLSETADFMKKQNQPSFSYVITLTSHTPFLTNESMRNLGIKESEYPDQVAGYLENMNYVDKVLGEFFDKLIANGLYEDSLIILYGDHTPVLTKFTAGTISYDPNSDQGKEVPLFIKLPNNNSGQTYPKKGSSLDIMPTILDLIGVRTNFLLFGQSLFASGDEALKVCENQMVSLKSSGDCRDMLEEEKLRSAEIIIYNQFSNISK